MTNNQRSRESTSNPYGRENATGDMQNSVKALQRHLQPSRTGEGVALQGHGLNVTSVTTAESKEYPVFRSSKSF